MPPSRLFLLDCPHQVPESSQQWPVAILLVSGLDTAGSVLRLRNVLLASPGVLSVEVGGKKTFARVIYDPSVVDPKALPSVVSACEPGCSARFLLLVRPLTENERQRRRPLAAPWEYRDR